MKWLSYFQEHQKQQALNCAAPVIAIEYGDCIHKSVPFRGQRWVVTNFHDEFVVFVEDMSRVNSSELCFAAAFASRNRAIGFAIEMFLVCCGELRLSNRRSLTKIAK